jgi:hypothetical protein
VKSKKKHVGIKTKKKRNTVVAIFLGFVMVVSVFFLRSQFQNQTINPTYSQLKAAIVDQLSLTCPNQTFIETATNILERANYTVDYYPGENVTVEFFGNLPTHGYRIIILRDHSSATSVQHAESAVTFFTSERYSSSEYLYEQLNDQLANVAFSDAERKSGITYFGIRPGYVTACMTGRFQDTTIIMMGCQGSANALMAEAFIEKGAKLYIGWSGLVSSSHTDRAMIRLLQHLVTEGQTISQAVENTVKEVGPDPIDKLSALGYYPAESGDQTIENVGKS